MRVDGMREWEREVLIRDLHVIRNHPPPSKGASVSFE